MKKFVSSMLACSAILIMATSSVAGEREGAFSISPFVGGYTFGGVQHLETSPVYGLRLGYDLTKNWEVEAVADYLATDGTLNNTSINALSYRLDILYNCLEVGGPLVPYVAVGGGGITYGHGSDGLKISGRTTDATANVGLGIKYFVTDSIALRGDARHLFVLEDPNSPKYNWEYSAGVTFLFGGKTPPVAVAKAPEPAPVPVSAPVPVPLAPSDSLTVVPSSIIKGETVTLTWSSQDATTCDIKPGIGAVQPQGSMTLTPADDTTYTLTCSGPGGSAKSAANLSVSAPAPLAPADNLTVVPRSISKGESATLTWSSQNATTCEIRPEIGPVQPQGSLTIAPAESTSYILSCAGDGGTAKSAASLSVMIPAPPAPAAKLCSPTVIDIQFDTNKSDIKPRYHDELKKLADFLAEFPKARGVIEGHTDSAGDRASNMKLSQRRADSVRSYLIKNFVVAPERLKATGYGPTKPRASNKTAEGKAYNRRIEANFICD